MKALIVDLLDKNSRQNESADKIAVKSRKYVSKHFKTPYEQELLSDIVNNAWDKACDIGEFKELSVSVLCMEMYDSRYKELLTKELGYKPKLFQNFYNATRQWSGLKTKIDSKKLADDFINIINKEIYDKFTRGKKN